jgi:outer membrane receptor protein involved in Fe transport
MLVALPALAAGPPYAGRPLRVVLEELSAKGLQLVYSSDVVPDSLRVTSEPAPGTTLQLLREVLAQQGLEAKPVGADTYAVVREAAPAKAAPARVVSAEPAPLEEVVVAASRYSLSAEIPDAHTVFTQEEIRQLPRLADDSLKAVHRLPAAASNGVSGLAYMRGGVNNETLVTLDGFSLYEPFHLKLLLSPTSLLDPGILSGMDVHAGGFTAEFGERMSSVIEATSIHPDADQHYELGLSMFNASLVAFNRFAEGAGQWLVAARRSNLDEIADLVDAPYGELSYSDAFGRLDYAFSPDTRGSLHVLLSTDDANVTNSQRTESSAADYRNTYAWATLEHDFSPRLRASAIASYTYVSTERTGEVDEDGIREGAVDDERHYDVAGLQLAASYTTERWLTRFGAQASSLDATYDYSSIVRFEPDYPFPGSPGRVTVNDLAPKPSGANYAAYVTSRFRVSDPLTAEVGLRWDDQTYGPNGGNQLAPRVNLLYQAGPQTRLRASWGRYEQAQGINELQVEDGVDRFFRPQYAYHEILGIEQGLAQGLTLRVEGYIKSYRDTMPRFESLYDPTALVPELRWDLVEIRPNSARAEGVEMLLTRRSASPWNGWFNYTWSRVTDRENGRDTPRSWDQTNNFGAGVTWTDGGWQATLAGTYHTGWPTTPLRLVVSESGASAWTAGPRNAGHLNAFASVDLRVSRDFALRHGTLNVFAEATNLLDRANHCCTDFSFNPTGTGAIELDREYRDWLPRVPNVGVLWKY